jgi:hypothetical protein
MGELMSVFEADYRSHNFSSTHVILMCGVGKKVELAHYHQLLIVLTDDGRLLIVVA